MRRRVLGPALLLAAALSAGCGGVRSGPLVLATTSSVANSGLLAELLPAYKDAPVHAIPVGSGVALGLLGSSEADVVITHAPAQEAEALREHPTWWYRKILYNDFLVVGPPSDPAAIAGLADAGRAMARIRDAGSRFISRGDESGTHERERELWRLAGGAPPPGQLVVAGATMGTTLRIAGEMEAYTLTDRATFEALSHSVALAALVSGDARLLNTYAVMADPSRPRGLRFARWLADGAGKDALERLLATGRVRGFSVWPAGTRADDPTAQPHPERGVPQSRIRVRGAFSGRRTATRVRCLESKDYRRKRPEEGEPCASSLRSSLFSAPASCTRPIRTIRSSRRSRLEVRAAGTT